MARRWGRGADRLWEDRFLHDRTLGRFVAIAVVSTSASVASAQHYRAVALSDQAAPGVPGAVFSWFDDAVINNAGVVAFTGYTNAGPQGIFLADGTVQEVVLSGASLPGGGTFTDFSSLILNNRGEIAFRGSGEDGSGFVSGFYTNANPAGTNPGNALVEVVRSGGAAPGVAGGFFEIVQNPMLNDRGETAFFGTVFDAGNTFLASGYWTTINGGSAGVPAPIAVTNGYTSVTDPDGVTQPVGGLATPASLNDQGQFAVGVNYGGLDTVAIAAGLLTVRYSNDDNVPGVTPSVAFSQVRGPAVNNAGEVAFVGIWDGLDQSGVFTDAGGSLVKVAGTDGGNAPGAGTPFTGFAIASVTINTSGDVAFVGYRSGTTFSGDTEGIFFKPADGELRAIALEDPDPSSGLINFSRIRDDEFWLNALGQVAFLGRTNDRSGLYLTDPLTGEVVLIAEQGMLWDFDGLPGGEQKEIDFVTVAGDPTGNEDGRASPLNDNGEIVFVLEFTDSTSGVYVASVPEPTTALALLTGGALLARRRMR